MVELARNYHQNLQDKDTYPTNSKESKKQAIQEVLSEIPENQKSPNPKENTQAQLISEWLVETTIKTAKNGSATSHDGCPYKLWKALSKRHEQATVSKKPSFNIIKTLTLVF
jgi:hypothetical protein